MKQAEDRPLRIAVSGFDGLDNPHPGIGVARALRAGSTGPIEIHALCYDSRATGAWAPGIADRIHVMPSTTRGEEVLFQRLMEIHGATPLDAVVPCLDLEIPLFTRVAGRLARAGIRNLLPPAESVFASSKLRLPKWCHDNGIPCPRTIHIFDLNDLPLHGDQFGYPLMVKGTIAGAKRVDGAAQAVAEAHKLNDLWGGGVLLQEIVAGEEVVVAAVAGGDGRCLGHVAMRKLGVNSMGKGIFGAVIDDPVLAERTRTILEKLNWRGPIELEFIRVPGSQRLFLIEVNCRFPSWIMLSHWAGCNLPLLLVQEILRPGSGEETPARAGTTFVRDVCETAVPFDKLRRLERFGSCNGSPPVLRHNRARGGDGLRVAVTGIGTMDVVNSGLGVARALRQRPEVSTLLGMGYGTYDSGLFRADLFDATYRLPDVDDAAALRDRLMTIHRAAPFDVIIPCLDGELPRFQAIAEDLAAAGIATLLPSPAAFARRGKPALGRPNGHHQYGGFEVPETVTIASERDLVAAVRTLGLPVAVKGTVSLATKAESMDEAKAAWGRLRAMGNHEALVQPYITGEPFAVAAVCDRQHRPLGSFAIKKLRLCERGSTWSAVTTPLPELEHGFAAFLTEIGWVGPAEGEFLRDEDTETFHLIEVNPRFTAWIGFSAFAGANHPLLAVRAALGLEAPDETIDRSLVFMRNCEDIHVAATAFAAIASRGELAHD